MFQQLEIQDPAIWGPPLWNALHLFAANYSVYFEKPKPLSAPPTTSTTIPTSTFSTPTQNISPSLTKINPLVAAMANNMPIVSNEEFKLSSSELKLPSSVSSSTDVPTLAEKRQKVKDEYLRFFSSLQVMLPCEKCREHYTAFLKEHPIEPYLNTLELDEWVTKLHNTINRLHGVEEWPIEKVRQKYDKTKTFIVDTSNPLAAAKHAVESKFAFEAKQVQQSKSMLGFSDPQKTLPIPHKLGGINNLYFQTHQLSKMAPSSTRTMAPTHATPSRTILPSYVPPFAAPPGFVPSGLKIKPTVMMMMTPNRKQSLAIKPNNETSKTCSIGRNGIRTCTAAGRPGKKKCGCRR